ncbi:MAG: ABC transporter ATP-binding protein [Infirmifilum sp.]
MEQEIVSLRDVSVTFKQRKTSITAVRGISLDLRRGKIISVVGESGSGKTTLGRVITLLERPTQGSVLYKGVDAWSMKPERFMKVKVKLQYVYQDPYSSLNPVKSVYETLAAVIKSHRKELGPQDIRGRVVELLELVGLTPPEYFLNKYPHHLSGGMRQRLNIARALIPDPEVLVADEPVSMVDPSLKVSILDLLRDLNAKLGVSIVYITHELGTIKYLAPDSKMLVMLRGVVVEEGMAREVIEKPLHPYTVALLAFSSALDPWLLSKRELFTRQPKRALSTDAKGCPFADRCPWARENCAKSLPPLASVDGRRVRCFYADEVKGALG